MANTFNHNGKVVITDGGNVGIGTTAPTAKLQVVLPANTSSSIFQSTASEALLNIQTFPTTNRMQLLVGDYNGTSTPNIAAISDSNTGIQWAGSDILRFVNGGSENVTINASGNVGIGTTSPSQKLEVSGGILGGPVYTTSRFIVNSIASPGISDISLGSYVGGSWLNTPASTTGYLSVGGSAAFSYSSSNLIWYTDSGSGITEKMRITTAGNVGIGTTSPGEKLHIGGNVHIAGVGSFLYFDTTGSAKSISQYVTNDFQFHIYNNRGNSSRFILGNDDISLGTSSSRILYISTSNNNVGINNTSPFSRLQVSDSVTGDAGITIHNNAEAVNNSAAVWFKVAGSPSDYRKGAIFFANNGTGHGRGSLFFATNDSANSSVVTTSNARMTITSAGNVGIGATTFGTAKLVVNGNLGLSGTSGAVYGPYFPETGDHTGSLTMQAGFGSAAAGGAITLFGHLNTTKPGWVTIGISQSAGTGATEGRFTVNSSATAGGTDVFTVLRTGNVGIGTTSPSTRLHIDYTSGTGLTLSNTQANLYAEMRFQSATSSAYIFKASNGYSSYGGVNALNVFNEGQIAFHSSSVSNILYLTSGGNVGIGTTAPSEILQLSKSQSATTRLEITNSNTGGGTLTRASLRVTANDRIGEMVAINGDSIYVGSTSNHNVALMANGEGVLFATPAGNVGIGTTAPTVPLQIVNTNSTISMTNSTAFAVDTGSRIFLGGKYSSATSNNTSAFAWLIGAKENATDGNQAGYLSFTTTANGGGFAERMRVSSTGNVGIGTSSPADKLDVSNGHIRITNGYVLRSVTSTGSAAYPLIGMQTDTVVVGSWEGNFGTNLSLRGGNGAVIADFSQGNSSFFAVRGVAGSTPSEYLRVISNGNVGIGTTSPSQKLQVSGSTIINGTIYSGDGSISTSNSLQLQYDASSGDGVIASKSTGGNTTLALQTSNSGTTTTKLYITSAGNVGIGTTSPTNKLHVNGGSIFNQNGFLYMSNQFPIVWGAAVSIEGDNAAGTLTLKTESSHRIFINNVGNVGINTTAPQQLLHVLGATNGYMMVQGANDAGQAGIYFKKEDTTGTMDRTKGLIVFHTNVGSGFGRGHLGFCLNSAESNATVSVSDEKFRMVDNGDFLADGDVVAYSTTISDERYKTNITPIESALDKVNQMRGVSFDWTAVRSGREFGVIAQEIEKIAPEVVSEKELLNGETMKTVSYTSLVPFLIESIKELTARVEELEQKLKQ
jgi:hypothetical protein